MTYVKFLSLDELEELHKFSQNLAATRGFGKTTLTIESLEKAAKGWVNGAPIGHVYSIDPTIQEMFDFELRRDPHHEHRLPGLNPLVVAENYKALIEGDWIVNTKPKNTYKPHSFQPAKGDAPRSCKPNMKTVAKNRAKRKMKNK